MSRHTVTHFATRPGLGDDLSDPLREPTGRLDEAGCRQTAFVLAQNLRVAIPALAGPLDAYRTFLRAQQRDHPQVIVEHKLTLKALEDEILRMLLDV